MISSNNYNLLTAVYGMDIRVCRKGLYAEELMMRMEWRQVGELRIYHAGSSPTT
jgi:hypothetical protein